MLRDAAGLRRQLVGWIGEQVTGAGLRGAVFGLSGGVDSAVVCGLCAEALGPQRCLGLVAPIESSEDDARLAGAVAEHFEVPVLTVLLDDAFQAVFEVLSKHREAAERFARGAGDPSGSTSPAAAESTLALARMNLKPRLRMLALYYYANLLGYAVLGTGNRAELAVGYFTKWGDGAVDLLPLGDLVKAEVRALAVELEVPGEVVSRAPTAGLEPGQTDEGELGFGYDDLDRWILEGSSGDVEVDARIQQRAAASGHKREAPPIARPR